MIDYYLIIGNGKTRRVYSRELAGLYAVAGYEVVKR